MLRYCALTDKGKCRDINQDNFFLNGFIKEDEKFSGLLSKAGNIRKDGFSLFAVADGMGGECFGEKAAFTAVKGFLNIRSAEKERIESCISAINEEICQCREEYGCRIGTTFAMVAVEGARVVVANAGDSRVYLFRGKELKKISNDNTLVARLVREGIITPEEALVHPQRHMITQFLGINAAEGQIRPTFREGTLTDGDIYLICSDGLTDMVSDSEIAAVLSRRTALPDKVNLLFSTAMRAGGEDNITIVLVENHVRKRRFISRLSPKGGRNR